jgi:hypothetical protein
MGAVPICHLPGHRSIRRKSIRENRIEIDLERLLRTGADRASRQIVGVTLIACDPATRAVCVRVYELEL